MPESPLIIQVTEINSEMEPQVDFSSVKNFFHFLNASI